MVVTQAEDWSSNPAGTGHHDYYAHLLARRKGVL